jgi:hypothetical protein
MKPRCEIFVGVEVVGLDHDRLRAGTRRDGHVGPEHKPDESCVNVVKLTSVQEKEKEKKTF